jgi:hypothetical protein
MTDSAERPLIGPETGSDTDATVAIDASIEMAKQDDNLMPVSPRREQERPGWYKPAAYEADPVKGISDYDLDDDGPVIRRMGSPHTPGMFSRQLGSEPGYEPDEFDPLAAPLSREREPLHPPSAHIQHSHQYPRGMRGHENEEFSVAAIRERRMRRPAGTHTPTRLRTKLTVAALASVCMMSAGVALGLYGQDIGHAIEQQARVASTAVNSAIGRVVSATVSSLDQGSDDKAKAGPDRIDTSVAAAPEAVAQPTTPVAGRKLIYKRLPTATENTASAPEAQREVRTVNAAALGGLEQLLAPPADFAPGTNAVD